VFPPGVLTIVQPAAGSPLKVTLPVGNVHDGCIISLTAGAEGSCWNVIVTSSVDEAHGGLLIVQRRVYVVPARPEKVLEGFDGSSILPSEPDTMLQLPVPIEGVFAASVVVVRPHISDPVWSGPAFAVVGL
jgi:hypothetical protein